MMNYLDVFYNCKSTQFWLLMEFHQALYSYFITGAQAVLIQLIDCQTFQKQNFLICQNIIFLCDIEVINPRLAGPAWLPGLK